MFSFFPSQRCIFFLNFAVCNSGDMKKSQGMGRCLARFIIREDLMKIQRRSGTGTTLYLITGLPVSCIFQSKCNPFSAGKSTSKKMRSWLFLNTRKFPLQLEDGIFRSLLSPRTPVRPDPCDDNYRDSQDSHKDSATEKSHGGYERAK